MEETHISLWTPPYDTLEGVFLKSEFLNFGCLYGGIANLWTLTCDAPKKILKVFINRTLILLKNHYS